MYHVQRFEGNVMVRTHLSCREQPCLVALLLGVVRVSQPERDYAELNATWQN